MSMSEFYQWCGYLRRNPVGWRWLSREFASLKREVAMTRMTKGKPPPLDHFLWKPPEPLFYQRKKREAERK